MTKRYIRLEGNKGVDSLTSDLVGTLMTVVSAMPL